MSKIRQREKICSCDKRLGAYYLSGHAVC